MEYYSTKRNNDMWFESKWMQLEDIVLSEVRQNQNQKRHVFSHTWKIDPKTKMCTKTSMIIYKFRCRNMFVIMELLYETWRKRERKKE
jgi:hypothetical protein